MVEIAAYLGAVTGLLAMVLHWAKWRSWWRALTEERFERSLMVAQWQRDGDECREHLNRVCAAFALPLHTQFLPVANCAKAFALLYKTRHIAIEGDKVYYGDKLEALDGAQNPQLLESFLVLEMEARRLRFIMEPGLPLEHTPTGDDDAVSP